MPYKVSLQHIIGEKHLQVYVDIICAFLAAATDLNFTILAFVWLMKCPNSASKLSFDENKSSTLVLPL